MEKEKRFFSKEYNEAEERLRKQREKDESNRKKKTSLAISDDDSDDLPLITKRKREVAAEASDDDTPIVKAPIRKKVRTNSPVVDTNTFSDEAPGHQATASDDNWATSLFSSPEPEATPAPRTLPTPAPLPAPIPVMLPPPVSQPSATRIRSHGAVPQKNTSMSSLSTKKQIASGALALVPPKNVPRPAAKSKTMPPILKSSSSSSLIPLGFKKSTQSTSTMIPNSPVSGDAQVSIPPRQAIPTPTPSMRSVVPIIKVEFLQWFRLPERLASPQDAHIDAADVFLREIMPAALAGPLRPEEEHPFEPPPPRALISNPTPVPKKVQPLWTWSGNVFTETDPKKPLFAGTFCDATAFVDGGLRFSVVMTNMDRLDFTTFHDAVDLDLVLSACQGVHQFARLGPKSNADTEALGIFSSYMAKMQKARPY
ncbi:hypothetical protein C0992_002386 [Termitomyces sp. T32_za158]|nr:hypothetical protein C0992_002386 [Termitomyces sp. T32_za158]